MPAQKYTEASFPTVGLNHFIAMPMPMAKRGSGVPRQYLRISPAKNGQRPFSKPWGFCLPYRRHCFTTEDMLAKEQEEAASKAARAEALLQAFYINP